MRLLAYSGREVRTWESDEPAPGQIRIAKFVREPNAQGGRRLAVLAFAGAYGASPHPNSLCVYDVDGNLDIPLWERHIEDGDIPDSIRESRGFVGREFGAAYGVVEDVFADPVGKEIIAVYRHNRTTHSAVRVYGLQGAILYQVWVDASITGVYWMSSARLLVLAGVNGSAYWPQRGYPNVRFPHPSVVFAIRLEVGFIAREYLSELPGDDLLSPVWYKCLLPPKMSDEFNLSPKRPSRPGEKYDPGRSVEIALHAHVTFDGRLAGFGWVLDEFGKVIEGSLVPNDLYQLNLSKLPTRARLASVRFRRSSLTRRPRDHNSLLKKSLPLAQV